MEGVLERYGLVPPARRAKPIAPSTRVQLAGRRNPEPILYWSGFAIGSASGLWPAACAGPRPKSPGNAKVGTVPGGAATMRPPHYPGGVSRSENFGLREFKSKNRSSEPKETA